MCASASQKEREFVFVFLRCVRCGRRSQFCICMFAMCKMWYEKPSGGDEHGEKDGVGVTFGFFFMNLTFSVSIWCISLDVHY